MQKKNKIKLIGIFVILLTGSSFCVRSEDNWWEYKFYEGLKVGEKVEWKIERLTYDEPYLETIMINESQGDIITFNLLHHPNDVIVYPGMDHPFALPSYYFTELPYEILLNNEEVSLYDFYFVPRWANYSVLISPYYFRSNEVEYNIFENEQDNWESETDHNTTYSEEGDGTYLNYTYYYSSYNSHEDYCSIEDGIYTYTYTDYYEMDLHFYDEDINRTIGGETSISYSYNINTGILLSFSRYSDREVILFYPDYIDFNYTNQDEDFYIVNTEQESGIFRINYIWIVPIFITTLIVLTIFRSKYD